MPEIKCLSCNEKFVVTKPSQFVTRKYCSKKCYGQALGKKQAGIPLSEKRKYAISKSLTGRTLSEAHKKAVIESLKGRVHSEETKAKMRKARAGEKAYQWKGNNVGYSGLHLWVYKILGDPTKCEFCSKTDGWIEWANKSRTYQRDISDWIALCRPCHALYDGTAQKISKTKRANKCLT